MTWPPTRPIRQRLFGALFLAVWMGGMYLCWGWPQSGGWDGNPREGLLEYKWSTYGPSRWLSREQVWKDRLDGSIRDEFKVAPRGLTVALIMTAVSSLILYVGWRAAVSGLPGPRGVCDGCGYDLRALSAARCPECGEARGA